MLAALGRQARRSGVNIRYGAKSQAITGQKGAFNVSAGERREHRAEHVVLAIGLEGNPRKLGAPGEDLERVQYQLDDPKEFRDETILVVGAGDSAIENALALAEQNDVWIVNRGKEFSRAKDANLSCGRSRRSATPRRFNCLYEDAASRVSSGRAERRR